MISSLIHRVLPLAAAAGLLVLGGCASAPAVRADYDRTADFTQYKTFAFANPLGTDRGGYQSIVSQHLKAATQRELEARGLRLDPAAPQLLVNFNASLNEKMRVSSMPTPVMGMGVGHGYYGYRAGMYGAWPMYVDQTTVTPYHEGTLNIDVVDASRKQLVWEGVVTDTVTQKMMDDMQATLDAVVAAAFAKYPVPGPAK
ncbi:MAG: DUF4136 domain-containing protein [Rubrivivax sp.]|nr:DUF4136 domain-containing protein [Rubrivivax sp.]MDH5340475.1 DUF4136 domain-containing protein [Rubrivivax sp.]